MLKSRNGNPTASKMRRAGFVRGFALRTPAKPADSSGNLSDSWRVSAARCWSGPASRSPSEDSGAGDRNSRSRRINDFFNAKARRRKDAKFLLVNFLLVNKVKTNLCK